MLMEEMTWEEIKTYFSKKDIVIFPIGSTEQQGPHMGVGFESILAKEVANALGQEMETLVCPVFPVNFAEQMIDFPGTLSIPKEILTEAIYHTSRSMVSHGTRRLMFVNVHLGSLSSLEITARRLRKESDVRCATIDVYSILKQIASDILNEEDEPFGHASVVQVSLALYLCPYLVKEKKIISDYLKPLSETISPKGSNTAKCHEVNVILYSNTRDGTVTGCGGNATKAYKQLGEVLFHRLLSFSKVYLEEFYHMKLGGEF